MGALLACAGGMRTNLDESLLVGANGSSTACRNRISVVFVLDGSGSISDADWRDEKSLVSGVARGLEFGRRAAAAGIVQYTNTATAEVNIVTDKDRFLRDLQVIRQKKGGPTYTDKGLNAAALMIQQSRRFNAAGRVVLLSDGDADPLAEESALKIEQEGGTVLSVAVGPDADREQLRRLASSRDLFFEVSDFSSLKEIRREITKLTCDPGKMKPVGAGGKRWVDEELSGQESSDETDWLFVSTSSNPGGGGDGDADRDGDGGDGKQDHGGDTPAPTKTTTTETTTTVSVEVDPELEGACALQETHKYFRLRYERWMLLTALGDRLQFENEGQILDKFRHFSDAASDGIYDNIASNWTYARSLGKQLRKASDEVDFRAARALQAEVQEYIDLQLYKYEGRGGSPEHNQQLAELTEDMCQQMRSFIRTAKATERSMQLYRNAEPLWNSWQQAWGPVRVFVKVTTQCRLATPPGMDPKVFLRPNYQDQWATCSGVEPWAPNQFPSAVMACARPDGEHVNNGGPVLDRDRIVRYLGCGASRLTRSPSEPPMTQGVAEGCSQGSEAAADWMTNMCGPGSIQDKSCRMYGPFWAVYSAPLENIYGKKDGGTGKCALTEEENCGEMAQAEAFKGQVKHNSMAYIYGALPPLPMSKARAWKESKTPQGWEAGLEFPMPEERRLDPPMAELLREAEVGNGITMIAYGYSGAGKTTTLVGDAGAPVGGVHGIDGVVSIYLKENSDRIKDIKIRVVEVYGRLDPGNGRLMAEEGSGLWGFELKSKAAQYLGPIESFFGADGRVDFGKIDQTLSDPKYTVNLRELISKSTSGRTDWGSEVKMKLTDIENLRMNPNTFPAQSGSKLAHIRATPNNPKSSRGTMIIMLDIEFNSGETGSVSVVDLAGAEDPAVLVEGFMSFFPKDGVSECITNAAWTPGGPSASNAKLIRKYMHEMSNNDYLNNTLSPCVKLRDFLVPCDRKKPKPECVDIQLGSGKMEFVRPDPTADEAWTYKTFRDASTALDFTFETNGQTVVFKEEEVLEAMDAGVVSGTATLKKSSSLVGKDECGPTETEHCPGSWVERLWGRCGEDEDGKCVRVGEIDSIIIGQELTPEDFDFQKKFKDSKTYKRAWRGIPKHVVTLSGMKKGEAYRRGDTAELWQKERKRFWREVHDYLTKYENKEAVLKDKWDLHLQYFVKAVGPMVQESMFINEVLNQMKSYLGAWSSASSRAPPGAKFDLWPVASLKEQAKTAQVIDASPDSPYIRDGYDLYGFVKSSDPAYNGESYAERTADGRDDIMMLSLLEYMRKGATDRDREAKVLFGAFIRTDQPGADPDCDGARVSLEFAQQLSEAVGWKRAEALHHLR